MSDGDDEGDLTKIVEKSNSNASLVKFAAASPRVAGYAIGVGSKKIPGSSPPAVHAAM